MSPMSIVLLCICIPIALFLILWIVTYILYHVKPTPLLVKIYHDKLDYHLPDHNHTREMSSDNQIQFISRCKYCRKSIFLTRKNTKKWKLINEYQTIYEEKKEDR